MSNRFIRDPREAVRVGDVVQVKVISIEVETKRIGLSMKALLPELLRRRKKVPNRRPRPASNTASDATSAPAEGAPPASAAPQEQRRRPAGRPSGRPRRHRAEERRPANQSPAEVVAKPEESAQTPEPEPEPAGPPPSLQEKIALLQSKFKGIE
jgi:transcriptional accessory protein Tex/SPT6